MAERGWNPTVKLCYSGLMTPKLIQDLRAAIADCHGKLIEIEDAETHAVCVLMTRDEFRRLVDDDSELPADEMDAAARQGLSDEEGWSAPGMERSGPVEKLRI
jgi:hypothetical protein